VISGIVAPEEPACTVRAREAALVRLPEVPVKVTVDCDETVPVAAVNVVFCAVPGTRFKVAGFAVTPDGSPVMATATVPVKEFAGVALTLMGEPAAPATRVSEVGATESVKLGVVARAVRVSAALVVWLKVPEVPVKVSVADPGLADEEAVSVKLCGVPGVSVRVEGVAVTPAGKPLRLRVTGLLKLFVDEAVTLACCPAPPMERVKLAGVAEREKSPA